MIHTPPSIRGEPPKGARPGPSSTALALGMALLVLAALPGSAAAAVFSEVLSDGKTTRWVTLGPGAADPGTWSARLPGLDVEGRLGADVQVRLPPDQVESLAALPGVLHVGLPPRPVALAESEGLAGMRVKEFWSLGHRGRTVKIGILDLGFAGYDTLVGRELPAHVKARSFFQNSGGTGDITGGGDAHGTACAEVLSDVAPECDLYLSNVASPVDLSNAVNWMIEQGVEVISHSVGWFLGSGDGTGPIQDIVARARQNGILWVSAAGNFAEAHWTGSFHDANADGIVEVFPERGEEYLYMPTPISGQELQLILLWDHWPLSQDLSFQLDLFDGAGTRLLTSETDYAGYPYAIRSLALRTAAQGLRVRIRLDQGVPTGSTRLRVFRTDGSLQPESRVPEGSIAMPADSPDALSVGAFAWSDDRLEPFSSRGPTATGRMKPELLGPDGITTSLEEAGYAPFYGTSAACPHVAGAVGLLLSASVRGGLFDTRWSPEEILRMLRTAAAAPAGSPDPGAVGWGCVRMLLNATGTTVPLPRLVVYSPAPGNTLRLRLMDPGDRSSSCVLFDVLGRRLGEIPGAVLGPAGIEYRLDRLTGPAPAPGRYWAMEPTTGARVGFYWPGGRHE